MQSVESERSRLHKQPRGGISIYLMSDDSLKFVNRKMQFEHQGRDMLNNEYRRHVYYVK